MLRKFRFLLLLLFLTGIINIISLVKIISLNHKSLELVKTNKITRVTRQSIFNDNCHFYWLYFVDDHINMRGFNGSEYLLSIINCSKLHLDMLYLMFPKDLIISQQISNNFPNNVDYLYWVLDSINNDVDRSKAIIDKIFYLKPNDSKAWRSLGNVLWNNAEYSEGLEAYLNACYIDDKASNGCYYVGSSYRTLGDIENAIYYFRKSYWPPSWEQADILEAELSTQNP